LLCFGVTEYTTIQCQEQISVGTYSFIIHLSMKKY